MTNDEIFYAQYLMGNNSKLIYGIDTAIKAIAPSAAYDMQAGNGIFSFTRWECNDVPVAPTKERIMLEHDYQKEFCEYHQYFLDRATNYPDISILMNQLWDAMDQSKIPGKGTDFYNSIKEVNDKFPKPEGKPPVRPELTGK